MPPSHPTIHPKWDLTGLLEARDSRDPSSTPKTRGGGAGGVARQRLVGFLCPTGSAVPGEQEDGGQEGGGGI